MRAETLAASVGRVLQDVIAPMRIQLLTLDDHRSRHELTIAELMQANAALRERLAALEARPPVAGPPGPPGPAGADGINGKDGTAGLRFTGVYVDGCSYHPGDLVTWAGSSWHCNEPTASKPGDGSKAWTLMVKRGRDGKDGKA
jgi:hypothetical protein